MVTPQPLEPVHPAERLWLRWENGEHPDITTFVTIEQVPTEYLAEILRIDLQQRWRLGERVLVESYLDQFADLADDREGTIDLVYSEFLVREQLGEPVGLMEYESRFPHFATELRRQIELHRAMRESVPDSDETLPGNGLVSATNPLGVAVGQAMTRPRIPGYEILGELGRGGMAVVYKARHIDLNRFIALKVLLADVHASDADRLRFRTEAAAVARLQHPNIVQIFEIGEHEGKPYLALEFVEGGSLSASSRGHPVPATVAAQFMKQIASAVDYAHRQGVIHRDLKPSNVLLHRDGLNGRSDAGTPALSADLACATSIPKISDFGLARVFDHDVLGISSDVGLTRSGDVLGTPSYMAPEQAKGHQEAICPATDVYSLGAILYELLTGRPPFQGVSSIEILQQVVNQDALPPSRLVHSIPRDLETICLKCLEKSGDQRYATAAELQAELDAYLHGEPIRARPASIWRRTRSWTRRHPASSSLILLALLSVITANLVISWNRRNIRDTQAAGLVEALGSAETSGVPKILDRLNDYPESLQLLEHASQQATPRSRSWFQLQLALVRHKPESVSEVASYASQATAEQVPLLVAAVKSHDKTVAQGIWESARQAANNGQSLLSTAAVLAALQPEENEWQGIADQVAEELLQANPLEAGRWTGLLYPVRNALREPLTTAFRDRSRSSSERGLAASILGEHHSDQPDFLAELLLDADADQFHLILPHFAAHTNRGRTYLGQAFRADAELTIEKVSAGLKSSPESILARERIVDLARRKARAAIGLAHLGQSEELLQLFSAQPDPTARSFAIELAAPCHLSQEWLLDHVSRANDPNVQAACLLALGGYHNFRSRLDEKNRTSPKRQTLISQIEGIYREHPEASVRQASGWLLRRWGLADRCTQVDKEIAGRNPADRKWFVNSQLQTFIVLQPAKTRVGSPDWEDDHEDDEVLQELPIVRPFAVSAMEVTREQFKHFRTDPWTHSKYSPHEHGPVVNTSWFDAARYCRWLSEHEGLPEDQMCFPGLDEIKPGMTLPANYLDRTGYRLPTELEWEYACRAGTTTAWCFGLSADLLSAYVHGLPHAQNRAAPAGHLKPNLWGIFDTHANAGEWCANKLVGDTRDFGQDMKEHLQVDSNMRRTRGGYFGDNPFVTRSARRNAQPSEARWSNTGFRPVRTMTAGTSPAQPAK